MLEDLYDAEFNFSTHVYWMNEKFLLFCLILLLGYINLI